MDASLDAERPEDSAGAPAADLAADTPAAIVDQTSAEYLGRWNRLVSTTNWEKGRIISEWRRALVASGAAVQSYSDEAWSRCVGNVSSQHVGRLRRVWERFAEITPQYPGLYWSHFQAALDWHDAEMWLEGAVQNGWSVAQMRQTRWESIGSPPDQQPREQDAVLSEIDEDADPAGDSVRGSISESLGVVQSAEADEADDEAPFDDQGTLPAGEPAESPLRPFENLATLPDDLALALEALKLAIINHRLAGWQEISCGDVLAALDALKQLALAPADG